jgi:hypothetical protein
MSCYSYSIQYTVLQDHLPLGEIKKLLEITNIPLAPLLAHGFA